jgi:hypothetical protein
MSSGGLSVRPAGGSCRRGVRNDGRRRSRSRTLPPTQTQSPPSRRCCPRDPVSLARQSRGVVGRFPSSGAIADRAMRLERPRMGRPTLAGSRGVQSPRRRRGREGHEKPGSSIADASSRRCSWANRMAVSRRLDRCSDPCWGWRLDRCLGRSPTKSHRIRSTTLRRNHRRSRRMIRSSRILRSHPMPCSRRQRLLRSRRWHRLAD